MHKPDGIFGVFEVVKDFYEHGIDEHLWVFLLMLVGRFKVMGFS